MARAHINFGFLVLWILSTPRLPTWIVPAKIR